MDRVIKFRAWDGEEMYSHESIGDDYDFQVAPTELLLMVNEQYHETGSGVAEEYWQYIEKNNSVFMQFTGLTDKNGVDVYEGDVVDIHQTVNGCNIFIVEWKNLGFTVKYGCEMVIPRFYEYSISDLFEPCKISGEVDYEVIGNIHENPELLEANTHE